MGATKEKIVEEKMKTKVLSESNKDLKERLAELENAVFELEEKLDEEGFKKTVKGFERAWTEQSWAISPTSRQRRKASCAALGGSTCLWFASRSKNSGLAHTHLIPLITCN